MKKRIISSIALLSLCLAHTASAGLFKNQVQVSEGAERTYDIYVPERRGNNPRPLVMLLHGHMGNADAMTGESGKKAPYKVWLDIAEREGWFLLIPDGVIGPDDYRGWNDCRSDATTNPDSDDVAFLDALIDRTAEQYPIDKNRIYAHGTSNGGNMVFRLALERGDTYRAVAAVVASMPVNNDCNSGSSPVSVLIMNGTEDPLLPYKGGDVGLRNPEKDGRGKVMSTDASIQYWLKHNGIESAPELTDFPNVTRRDKSTVHVAKYTNKKNDSEVVLYEVRGGGHTEPSLSEHYSRLFKLIVGPQNKDIEMAEEVWKFFDRQR